MKTIPDLHTDDAANREQLRQALIQARLDAGLTLRQLGDILGRTDATVWATETSTGWHLPNLARHARALGAVLTLDLHGLPALPPDPHTTAAWPTTGVADAYDQRRAEQLVRHLAALRVRRGRGLQYMAHRMKCGDSAVSKWELHQGWRGRLVTAQRYTRALGGALVAGLAPIQAAGVDGAAEEAATVARPDDTAVRRAARDRLVEARLDAGMRQVDLAHALGYAGKSAVGQMERRDDWELPTLQTWAWALNHVVVFTVRGLPAPPPSPLDGVEPADPRLADEYDRQRLIDHLAHARERRGVSWAEMGRRMECTAWAAQKWFVGAHNARVGTVQRVVCALGGVLLVEVAELEPAEAVIAA